MGWLLTSSGARPCGEAWQACGGRGSGLAQAPLWEAPGWLAIDASGRMAQPMRASARRTWVAVPSAATWRLRAPLVECLCRGIQRWSWQAGLHFGDDYLKPTAQQQPQLPVASSSMPSSFTRPGGDGTGSGG